MNLKHKSILLTTLTLITGLSGTRASAQSNPVSLRPDVTVTPVHPAPAFCTGIALDPVTQQLHVTRANGELHHFSYPGPGPVTDTLLFTVLDHGISLLKGLMFVDSTVFLIGNSDLDTTQTIGIIKKGVLTPAGTRVWSTVMETVPYQLGNGFFDHGMSGLCLNPAKDSIYFNSGSRTDHGEAQTNAGMYPDLREVPLTSAIFRIPITANSLVLQNDSAALAPYLFADGTRNTFKMAFNGNGHLIGCENSGDRDDPDELNYLRKDLHYGFPWIMGGNQTPQQFPGYVPATDLLLNPQSNSVLQGFFYDDPSYPPLPPSLPVTDAIQNAGPDTDKYREPFNGTIQDASDLSETLGTFTPHKSPLGIVIDTDSLLDATLKGQAFILGNQRGGDSLGNAVGGGFGALLDPGEDFLALHMQYEPTTDTYSTQCTRIIEGFNRPVDACMSGTKVFVLEYGRPTAPATIYEISLPPDLSGTEEWSSVADEIRILQNPVTDMAWFEINFSHDKTVVLELTDIQGKVVLMPWSGMMRKGKQKLPVDVSTLPAGCYFLKAKGSVSPALKLIIAGRY
jgi:hypothetical protein